MYWWPAARWQHEGCVKAPVPVEPVKPRGEGGKKQGWDRAAYNAYQREYMKARRARRGK